MEQQANAASKIPQPMTRGGIGRKVVIRYANGQLRRGFLTKGDEVTLQTNLLDSIVVESSEGKLVEVRASEIKAIFFVKSFEGSPDYSEFKVFSTRPNGKGVWIRVHFEDGEVIEGVAPNCIDTYSKAVFYMTPPDPASNNQAVLVSKRFLKEMQVLGLASD